MRRIIALSALILLLTGCAAAMSTMISPDTAIVSVIGSSPADRERIIPDVLAEAGQVTATHGYRYFIILKAQDASRTGTMAVPDETIRRSAASNLSKPGASYVTLSRNVHYLRPGLQITIRMFHEGEIDPRIQGVWNTEGAMAAPPEKPKSPKERPRRSSILRG